MDDSPPVAAGDEPLWSRSVRFAATVLIPVSTGLALGGGPWLPYALLSGIAAFSADTGGRPWPRLGWIAASSLTLVAGATLGALVAGHSVLILIAFAAAGIIYALTESAHQIALTLSRFFHIALAIGALYAPIQPVDVAIVAAGGGITFAIALAFDAVLKRELSSTAPHWRTVMAELQARQLRRFTFAAALAVAVPAAYLASTALGLYKPYWTLLAMVLVLRVDFIESRRLMAERFLGTVLGVLVAGAIALAFPRFDVLIGALVIAALLRWPAQQRHGLLGVAALTAFVMLMIEIASLSTGSVVPILEARILDTGIGCLFALLALALEQGLLRLVRSYPQKA